MSTPSKSKPSPKPSLKLCAVIFPFAYGGVGVNVFFVFLLLQPLGFAAISPHMAALITLPLSIPATWLGARWIASLIAEAEKTPGKS